MLPLTLRSMYLIWCQPKLIYKKEDIEIEYLDKYRALHLSWLGSPTVSEYKAAMENMLELTLKYEIENWLIDAREAVNPQVREMDWSANFYKNELVKTKLRKIARIASASFIKELKISEFISKLNESASQPFQFRYTPDANTAFSWFAEGLDLDANPGK